MTKNSRETQSSEQLTLEKATRLALTVALEASKQVSLMLSLDAEALRDEDWFTACRTLYTAARLCADFAEKHLDELYTRKIGGNADDVESN